MVLRQLALCVVAAAGFMAFQVSHAQPVRACPDGQAVNSLHPNGTPVRCIPVVAPVDLAPLQQQIVQESAERKAADAELRAGISEASIVGRYALTGTQVCLNSSRGFNPVDLLAIMPPLAPPPQPGQPPQPTPITFVSQSTATVAGFRTFHAGGTGTSEFVAITLSHPGVVYSNFNGFVSAVVSSGPPGASTSTQSGTFQWEIVDGKVIIDDNVGNPTGTITAGGARVGWTATTRNLPKQVGVLGKDLKTISLTNDGPGVEISVLTSPPGQPPQVTETPRICHRERTLRKL